jgi:hypothetical protein
VTIISPLAEIPVVCDYPDVFPDELPGMPPDRDVEFVMNNNRVLHPFPKDLIVCHPKNYTTKNLVIYDGRFLSRIIQFSS